MSLSSLGLVEVRNGNTAQGLPVVKARSKIPHDSIELTVNGDPLTTSITYEDNLTDHSPLNLYVANHLGTIVPDTLDGKAIMSYLGATGSKLFVAEMPAVTDCTIQFYYKPPMSYPNVVSTFIKGNVNTDWDIDFASGHFTTLFGGTTAGTSFNKNLTDGQWGHICIMRKGTQGYVLYDGELVWQGTVPVSSGVPQSLELFGKRGGNTFLGSFAEITIMEGTLYDLTPTFVGQKYFTPAGLTSLETSENAYIGRYKLHLPFHMPPTFIAKDTTALTNGQPALRTYVANFKLLGVTAESLTKAVTIGGAGTPPAVPADPHFNDVTVLIPFNGPNDSTSFFDVKGSTVVNRNGSSLKNTYSKFGISSLSTGRNLGRSVTVDDAALVTFPGDFTIESWFIAPEGDGFLFGIGGIVGVNWQAMSLWISQDDVIFTASANESSGGDIVNELNIGTIKRGEFNHVAIVYKGSDFFLLLNGKLTKKLTGVPRPYNPTYGLMLGNYSTTTWGNCPNDLGNIYINEFRVTKFARYSADFELPKTIFPRSLSGVPGGGGGASVPTANFTVMAFQDVSAEPTGSSIAYGICTNTYGAALDPNDEGMIDSNYSIGHLNTNFDGVGALQHIYNYSSKTSYAQILIKSTHPLTGITVTATTTGGGSYTLSKPVLNPVSLPGNYVYTILDNGWIGDNWHSTRLLRTFNVTASCAAGPVTFPPYRIQLEAYGF